MGGIFIKRIFFFVILLLLFLGTSIVFAADDNNVTIHEIDDDSSPAGNDTCLQDYHTKAILKGNATKLKGESQHATKMTVSNKSAYINNKIQLTATVIDKTSNKYADGGKVVFKVNGVSVGQSTLTKGKAYYVYDTSKLSVKTYNLTAVYSGSGIYQATTSNKGYLRIVHIPTRMTISKQSAYSTKTVLKATIVDSLNNKYINGGKVVFKINNKTVGSSAIVNGKASVTYDATALYAGSYNISAVYAESKLYSSYRANSVLTIKTQNSFGLNDIKTTAVLLRTKYESNNIVNDVYISKSKLHVQDFLYLMANAVKNIYSSKTSNVTFKHFNAATSQSDTIKQGNIYKSEIVSLANAIVSYMNTYNKAPSYRSTSRGNLGYYNMIYVFTKILDVSSTSTLVSSSMLYNWKILHPSLSTKRPIYISSDNIYSYSRDMAFINNVKSLLEKKGYKVYVIGIGPNTHNTNIWSEVMPINAVQLSIFGGVDAGVIRDVTTRSFMRIKSNRMLFFAFNSDTAVNLTNLKWLSRAHDDNYSPASFTGISNPDKQLLNHGYDYAYTNNVNVIVNSLIKYIS